MTTAEHLPLVPENDETIDDPGFEEMLHRYGVTMYISGHHQSYYPGRRQNLRLLGTGCLGGGVRPLIGNYAGSGRTIQVIEVDDFGLRAFEAYGGADFRQARSIGPDSRASRATASTRVTSHS